MVSQAKAENKFLSISNACISHELRNPLNAIIAINMELKTNLQKMKQIVQSDFDI